MWCEKSRCRGLGSLSTQPIGHSPYSGAWMLVTASSVSCSPAPPHPPPPRSCAQIYHATTQLYTDWCWSRRSSRLWRVACHNHAAATGSASPLFGLGSALGTSRRNLSDALVVISSLRLPTFSAEDDAPAEVTIIDISASSSVAASASRVLSGIPRAMGRKRCMRRAYGPNALGVVWWCAF